MDPEPFKLAIESTIDIAGKVHNEAGIDFEFVDFGGGVEFHTLPEENIVDIDTFAKKILHYSNLNWKSMI